MGHSVVRFLSALIGWVKTGGGYTTQEQNTTKRERGKDE
jgi:hypothetical protein